LPLPPGGGHSNATLGKRAGIFRPAADGCGHTGNKRQGTDRGAAAHPAATEMSLNVRLYTNVIAPKGVLHQNIHFLQKPFSKNTLARKIKKALENGGKVKKQGPFSVLALGYKADIPCVGQRRSSSSLTALNSSSMEKGFCTYSPPPMLCIS